MEYDPYEHTENENVKALIDALSGSNTNLIELLTTRTGYFPMNYRIAGKALLELATEMAKFDCWMIIYNYLGANINNMPKGIYPFDYIYISGGNPDIRIFTFLIGLDIQNKNKSVSAALDRAVSFKKNENMMAILNSGLADPSCGLHSAVVLHQSSVEILLNYGAKLDFVNNNLDVISFALLREMPHPLLYARLPDSSNLLYIGLFNNDLKLIENNFETLSNNRFKLLPHPVLCAAQYSNIACIKLLIKLYKRFDFENETGPMINSMLGGNENIYNMVVKRPFYKEIYDFIFGLPALNKNNVSNKRTPLSYAVRQGDLIKTKYLLDSGCDINFITSEGPAVIECIYCCYGENNLEMMKLLLNYKANLYLKIPDTQEYKPVVGLNALDLCKRLNKPDPLKLLENN